MEESQFYQVTSDLNAIPIDEHLMHGYEDKWMFYRSVRTLLLRFKGRIGECIDRRHDFLLLRFHDTPGGMPDEEWLPCYLLSQTSMPDYMKVDDKQSDEDTDINSAFGF